MCICYHILIDLSCVDIYMKDIVTYGVIFNLYYEGVSATEMKAKGVSDIRPVDETTPEFRDMYISDIVCSGARQAVFINGLPELPVSRIAFRNCVFTAARGAEIHYAKDIEFDNVIVNGEKL